MQLTIRLPVLALSRVRADEIIPAVVTQQEEQSLFKTIVQLLASKKSAYAQHTEK